MVKLNKNTIQVVSVWAIRNGIDKRSFGAQISLIFTHNMAMATVM